MSRPPSKAKRPPSEAKRPLSKAKPLHSPIVDTLIDGGEIDEGGAPSGVWHVTADGQRLTPEEAFRRAGATEGRTMSPQTEACLIAAMFFMHEVGIKDLRISARALAEKIGAYASELELSGSENVGQHNSSFRAVLTKFLAEFKERSAGR